MLSDLLRKKISKYFTGNEQILFRNSIPENSVIEENIKNIEELGVYLHIPFCDQICPYCPYNKEIFSEEASRNYTNALKKEIDFYAPLLSDKPITNMYIGGGTPTTMLGNGIEEIIKLGDEENKEQDIFDLDYLANIDKVKLPNTKIQLLQKLLILQLIMVLMLKLQ